MDPDFLRELIVLAVTIGLYVIGSILLLRGHHVDLSAAHEHGQIATRSAAPVVAPRLNRRRKAIARDTEVRRDPESDESSAD